MRSHPYRVRRQCINHWRPPGRIIWRTCGESKEGNGCEGTGDGMFLLGSGYVLYLCTLLYYYITLLSVWVSIRSSNVERCNRTYSNRVQRQAVGFIFVLVHVGWQAARSVQLTNSESSWLHTITLSSHLPPPTGRSSTCFWI